MAKQSIPQASYPVNNVRLLPDQVKGDAPFVKETLDKGTEDGKTYINSTLIPALNGNTGANMIGLSNPNLSSDNVGDSVEEIRLIAVQAQAGELLPNSVTNTILGADVKVGSLSELTTTDKSTITSAINELEGEIDTLQTDVSNLSTSVTTNATGLEILRKYNVTTGSNVALAVDTSGTFDLTKTGNILNILPNVTNTGAMTINPDGQGAKSIKKFNVDTDAYVDVAAGDVPKNTPLSLAWILASDFFVLAPKGGATIKSIQQGSFNVAGGVSSANITVSSVDMSKSLLLITINFRSLTSNNSAWVEAKLTTSTNINLSRVSTSDNVDIEWQLIEYNDALVQRGETTMTTNSLNVTISSVNASKSLVYANCKSNDTSFNPTYAMLKTKITSSTNINIATKDIAGTNTVAWQVVEFK